MTAALSILSAGPSRSVAQVIGRVGRGNADWLAEHLRSLEGDVTLDCTRLRVEDRDGATTLIEFDRFLHEHGRRLVVRGLCSPPRRGVDDGCGPARLSAAH